MSPWPKRPLICEINTWVWLSELSRTTGRPVTLGTVPDQDWNAIGSLGFDAVWLMGVWERSPAGMEISLRNPGLLEDFRQALPDFSAADNVGSPYCVRRYVVDDRLGGPAGLAAARKKLAERNLHLLLDFVPNHVAPDHPWVTAHAEYFIQGTPEDLHQDGASFMDVEGNVMACGRDPYFPAWPDVVQLNAFDSGLRKAAVETVREIARQCDGVRCDMAMLMMNDVCERTWGSRAGQRPDQDYWPALIPEVRAQHPEFLFIAEAYWDLEWALLQQGFDFCYDKRLYDRLEHGSAESVRLHLCADLAYQEGLLRFIENHDEPRAAAVFSPPKHRAAALTALTLPGARLVHDGQMDGRKAHVPVFLARRPEETPDDDLRAFYDTLLRAVSDADFLLGTWKLCERTGWPDNATNKNLVGWCWRHHDSRALIVVNLSEMPSQALVQIPWDDLTGKAWRLQDVLTFQDYERDGDALARQGLYVDLPAWGFHFFKWSCP